MNKMNMHENREDEIIIYIASKMSDEGKQVRK